ncbi:MAG: hypothetical protein ACFFG0_47655 [Candidatus Thorarchaeota archaeon]
MGINTANKKKGKSNSKTTDMFTPPHKPQIMKVGKDIVSYTKRPLVVMYYCDINGSIFKPDISALFSKLTSEINGKVEEMDVLLHTKGGHPNTAYLLVQTLRKFTHKLNFLIPEHAYSGGTLMTLGADNIIMGPYASLGPIDLQLGRSLAVIDIDQYVQFVKHAKETITGCDPNCPKHESPIADSLLSELTREIPPTKIGALFRLRRLSEYYARVLLSDYMFKYLDYRKNEVDRIVKRLNSEYPSHGFDIDFHIANGLGLKVERMELQLFFMTDIFIKLCDLGKMRGEICSFLPRDKCEDKEQDFRLPFFEVFNIKKEGEKNEKRKK